MNVSRHYQSKKSYAFQRQFNFNFTHEFHEKLPRNENIFTLRLLPHSGDITRGVILHVAIVDTSIKN